MQRVKLSENLELSRIIYGMWRLGDEDDTSPGNVQSKIEACLEQGITSFDQADIYGDYVSEKLLGAALKQSPQLRDKMEIITKCDIMLLSQNYPERRVKYYDTSADHIRASVDASLSNMNIDVIDCLLLHRPDPFMDHHETGATLDAIVASGKVRTVGVSNFKSHDWTLLQSATKTQLVTNQIELSVLARDGFTNGDISFLQERDIRPMSWSPLGGGRLFDENDKSTATVRQTLSRIADTQGVGVDAVAVAWLLAHPSQILPVMGSNNLKRIAGFSDALKVEMDRETWFEILTDAQGHEVA